VQHLLAKQNLPHVKQSLCPPDMASCDFSSSPKLKPLNAKDLVMWKQLNIMQWSNLLVIPNNEFERCFQHWQEQ
jgi:hypothetical protein